MEIKEDIWRLGHEGEAPGLGLRQRDNKMVGAVRGWKRSMKGLLQEEILQRGYYRGSSGAEKQKGGGRWSSELWASDGKQNE